MSKFLCLGMPLTDVIAASTVNAAFALKRPELGSLKPGSVGDATILSVKDGRFDYVVDAACLSLDRAVEAGMPFAPQGAAGLRRFVLSSLDRREASKN
jgi:predicted amidohydrolase